MDKKDICQGWIYSIRNRINGKQYIGKTVDYKQRKWQHFHVEQCPALKNAFAKYGVENFEMRPILTFVAVNKKVCDNVLLFLEKQYIKKYDTFHNGYNLTEGGQGLCGWHHTEESKKNLSNKQKEYKAQDWVKQRDRERMLGNTFSEEFKRPILKYNLLGEFIKEYTWIGDAIEDIISSGLYTTNWRSIHSNIIRALEGNNNRQRCNKAYDSMWRYKDSEKAPGNIEPYRRKKEKPIYHYAQDGSLIESYRTLKEAEMKTGISIKTLKHLSYNGDLRRKQNIKCRKDYWSRENTAKNKEEICLLLIPFNIYSVNL